MTNYETAVNILDLIDAVGEDEVNRILSDFSCEKNAEIETFVKRNAVEFAKRKMSITYLLLDENGDLVAIFALTHKAIKIPDGLLSSNSRRKIQRYAQINVDDKNKSYTASAFLIAQFGKNFTDNRNLKVDGNSLMKSAMEVLLYVQHRIGGGVVYLECEDKPKLLEFYQNEENRFKKFGERESDVDNTKYIQLLRFF